MSPIVLFEQDLETLKNKVSEMGEHAEISYDRMAYGIRENKEDILKTLLNTDHTMVDMQRSIEAMCLSLLTRQQPVARDMRLVSAALKVVPDIERIGDHVADIVELYLRMGNMNPEGKQEHLLLEMMEEAKEMIHNSVEAFVEGDEACGGLSDDGKVFGKSGRPCGKYRRVGHLPHDRRYGRCEIVLGFDNLGNDAEPQFAKLLLRSVPFAH